MDAFRDYHTTWNKPEKDKYHDIAYMQNLKKKLKTNELIYKIETDQQT